MCASSTFSLDMRAVSLEPQQKRGCDFQDAALAHARAASTSGWEQMRVSLPSRDWALSAIKPSTGRPLPRPKLRARSRGNRPRANLNKGVALHRESIDYLPEALEVAPNAFMPHVDIRLDGHVRRNLAHKLRIGKRYDSVKVAPVGSLEHGDQSFPSVHPGSVPSRREAGHGRRLREVGGQSVADDSAPSHSPRE